MHDDGLKGVGQLRKLGFASDHARLDALHHAGRCVEGSGLGAQHQVGAHRVGDALDHERWLLRHLEHATDMAVGAVTDAQTPNRCGLLHAGRNADGNATDAALRVDPTTQ